ncbi:Hsp20/alpha crystallin family protein [Thiogranum longum]|jgi:HSP20 family protein
MAKKPESKTTESKGIQKSAPARVMSPFEEFERMFSDLVPRGWPWPMHREWPSWSRLAEPFEGKIPKVDVIDRDNEVVVRAEVAGVEKKDLDVSVTENTVTVKGSTKTEHKEEKGDYYRSEIAQGSFSRTVPLPGEVDADKAKATFKDGILELVIPKVAKSKRRSIQVD